MWDEIQDAFCLLDETIRESREYGLAMNVSEAHYYSVKAIGVRDLMDKGTSATAVQMLIKGEPQVNEALNAYRDNQVRYDNAREAINVLKLRIRVLEAQMEREWEQAKRM